MDEHSGVEESSKYVAYLNLGFSNGKVEAQVVASADSIQKAVELAKSVCDEWLGLSDRKDDIAEIAELGPVVVTKKMPVPEDEEASTVGVPADGDSNVPPAALALIQRMPLEDLESIARVVVDELARRRGPQDGDTETPNLSKIHRGIAGAEGTTGAPALRHSITNN